MLCTPIIKQIFEIYLGIICIAVGKNGKENMEGLKTVQRSIVVVTLLDNLLVKSLILHDFLVFYSLIAKFFQVLSILIFQYFNNI